MLDYFPDGVVSVSETGTEVRCGRFGNRGADEVVKLLLHRCPYLPRADTAGELQGGVEGKPGLMDEGTVARLRAIHGSPPDAAGSG